MTQIETDLKVKEEKALAEEVKRELEEQEKGELTIAELIERSNKVR